MERLTYFRGGCWWINLLGHEYGGFPEIDRLAAYEDTMTLERAQEIAQAEKDGRLVVLPCKVGDKVYQTDGIHIHVSEVKRIIFEADNIAFSEDSISKSIFLTRKEAEAALKKRGGGQ